METLMGSEPPIHWEAWHRIKGWYKAVVDPAPPTSWVTLEWIMAERVELYIYVLPPGTNTPIFVQPFPVDDSVTTEE